jgi:hypothetical protein
MLRAEIAKTRLKAAHQFKQKYVHTLKDFNFDQGRLVLIRNTQIEKSLNRKMRPWYLSPLIAISHNLRGAYILSELNGTVLHRPIATFQLLPYFLQKAIPLPEHLIDIDTTQLQEMERSSDIDGDEENIHETVIING